MTTEEEHLRLLSIFHYVVGGLIALFGCFPIIHVTFGLILILAPETFKGAGGEPPPAVFGLLIALVGAAVIAAFWTFAACMITAGRFLSLRKHYMFCLVMAALACMCSPFGTVLGVFTIIVLMREPIKQLFAANRSQSPTASAGGPLV
ncbi:MAG TPA: hypothetical protein VKH44_04525 [Pirellulaceae bacterium]|nr:hypothetical protein [Pirellulaceae bacterium]